jgi:hypothetical protein
MRDFILAVCFISSAMGMIVNHIQRNEIRSLEVKVKILEDMKKADSVQQCKNDTAFIIDNDSCTFIK